MQKIAIEGLDGSGKTSVADELRTAYENEGLSARVVAPYRLANELFETDIYPLWKSDPGAQQAAGILKEVLEKSTVDAEADGTDVLIFDRHWMTAFTEIETRPDAAETWGDNFVPTAYLTVDPATAEKRAQNDQSAPWMSRHNFKNYAIRYQTLCRTYGRYLLGIYRNDDDVSIDALVRSIMWDVNVRR